MPQINYPIMVSVDWLEFFGFSLDPIVQEPPATIFAFKQRPFGSKMWEYIYEVYNVEDGVFGCPFAVLCSGLRGKMSNPKAVSVKIANEQLYRADRWEKIQAFQSLYSIEFMNISRVDLAADFIYLKGRISGRQLVANIKNLKWWKCGSVNISEHYTMPYSVKWSRLPEDMDINLFQQSGAMALRTESLTFGTKASFAQVCIYDKTLELSSHEVAGVCAKEYIRDCWKLAGVYDPDRHTWRVEIRLSSKAATIADPFKAEGLRPLHYMDLQDGLLHKTFKSAADVWFRLVDASQGGNVKEITPEYCETFRKYKHKLKVVDLFPFDALKHGFVRRKPTAKPSRFTAAMMNALSARSREIGNKEIPRLTKTDQYFLDMARGVLSNIYMGQSSEETKAAFVDTFNKTYRQLCLDMRVRYDADPQSFTIEPLERRFLDFFNDPSSPLPADVKESIILETKNDIFDINHDLLTNKILRYEPR